MSDRVSYQTTETGLAALDAAVGRAQGVFRPRPVLTLSQWADEYAYIPPEAGAFPGKFHTDFAEYERGLQDAITDPENETIVFMLCAQSGKSQVQLNAVGFYTHWEPSPMLVVQASLGEAEKFSKNRIAKIIRITPVLKKLYPPPRARDSGNTLLNKEFPGGVLVLAGANAPAGLASMPIRALFADEVDRYEDSAGTEGDPVDLATKRTTTFWNRKIVLASTPGIKHLSRIEKAYEASDRRRFYVPCPHCHEKQTLEWNRLKWAVEPVAAPTDRPRVTDHYYVCANGCEIREQAKHEMIRRGEWRATARSHDGKTAGFQLNALYSPVLGWLNLIQEWLDAQNSLERMKTFINTRLAETWEIRGTGANMTELEKRTRFQLTKPLPAGVLWMTAGVDTQDNRLECSVWGWGLDDERWAIDHRVFAGDPSLPDSDEASPWAALREYLLEEWDHAAGVHMRIGAVLVDSGGHHTERVYEFTRKHELRRWHAIVGRGGIGKPLLSSGTKVGPYKTLLYTVGVDTAKEDIYTSLRVGGRGAGYTHVSDAMDGEYFRQLTSEKLVKTTKDFVVTMEWVKTSQRNEALDCAVYARAAVAVRRPNFRKLAKSLFRVAEENRRRAEAEGKTLPRAEEVAPQPSPPAPPKNAAPRQRPRAAERLKGFGRRI
ncbi:MAG: phage terminase large subunit family protein [Acidobacteriaceae bacterium]